MNLAVIAVLLPFLGFATRQTVGLLSLGHVNLAMFVTRSKRFSAILLTLFGNSIKGHIRESDDDKTIARARVRVTRDQRKPFILGRENIASVLQPHL